MFLFLAAFLLSDTLLTPVFWGRGTSALTDTGPCLEGGLGTLLMKLGAVEETNAAAPCPSAGAGSHHLGFKVGEVFNHSESPPSPICLRTVCTHPTPSFSIKSPLKPPPCAFFFLLILGASSSLHPFGMGGRSAGQQRGVVAVFFFFSPGPF